MKPATDDELLNAWGTYNLHSFARRAVYELGVEHGRQQAAEDRPLWPEPITDRLPTEADGDDEGFVQYMNSGGRWAACAWDLQVKDPGPWQHTPNWQSKPPTIKEQALEVVDRIRAADEPWALSDLDIIRRALEAQP